MRESLEKKLTCLYSIVELLVFEFFGTNGQDAFFEAAFPAHELKMSVSMSCITLKNGSVSYLDHADTTQDLCDAQFN